MRARALAIVVLSCAVAAAAASISAQKPSAKPAEPQAKSSTDAVKKPVKSKTVSPDERIDALTPAPHWIAPPPIPRADLGIDPKQAKEITCTFEITELGGTAPKFDCRSEKGERLRIKYGSSPEVPSEVAAAKLLHTLGFGSDNVTIVERVRCYGCP